MDEIIDSRNYFRRSAVRAKTLVRGDALAGSGLIVLNVYSGSGSEVSEIMRGSAMVVRSMNPDGSLSAEGLSDPSKIGMKMAGGYVLIKASATGKDDLDENVFFLTPAVALVEVWVFAENF